MLFFYNVSKLPPFITVYQIIKSFEARFADVKN